MICAVLKIVHPPPIHTHRFEVDKEVFSSLIDYGAHRDSELNDLSKLIQLKTPRANLCSLVVVISNSVAALCHLDIF